MYINNTLKLIKRAAHLVVDPKKMVLLHDDIIQAIKFDLGDEFSNMPGFEMEEAKISVPKLPYDKVYFEAVSHDGNRYGAIFENYGEYGVCGQVLLEAQLENSAIKGLIPMGVSFFEDGDKLAIHAAHAEGFEEKEIAMIAALDLMVKAIEVLNCSNVKTIDSQEKKFINKKRKAKGKLPLFTYKTLHIDTGEREEQKGPSKGAHASPRVHLRRGHIRKLAAGKTTWVQPCVVGDKSKGIVHKEYLVHYG
ncbi:MAG: hypothetical protein GY753_09715 [Gammaproteobacteria bacterium]|nr:hypothetical protein [Gammaproteobacteria bacterium]